MLVRNALEFGFKKVGSKTISTSLQWFKESNMLLFMVVSGKQPSVF